MADKTPTPPTRSKTLPFLVILEQDYPEGSDNHGWILEVRFTKAFTGWLLSWVEVMIAAHPEVVFDSVQLRTYPELKIGRAFKGSYYELDGREEINLSRGPQDHLMTVLTFPEWRDPLEPLFQEWMIGHRRFQNACMLGQLDDLKADIPKTNVGVDFGEDGRPRWFDVKVSSYIDSDLVSFSGGIPWNWFVNIDRLVGESR